MLFCLYALPKLMSRYAITSNDSYYLTNCLGDVSSYLGIPNPGNNTYNNGNPGAAWYCNVMNYCGFPKNSIYAQTQYCPLYKVVSPGNSW